MSSCSNIIISFILPSQHLGIETKYSTSGWFIKYLLRAYFCLCRVTSLLLPILCMALKNYFNFPLKWFLKSWNVLRFRMLNKVKIEQSLHLPFHQILNGKCDMFHNLSASDGNEEISRIEGSILCLLYRPHSNFYNFCTVSQGQHPIQDYILSTFMFVLFLMSVLPPFNLELIS